MKDIKYELVQKNINEMINVLEFDGMRSAGKIKINAQTLYYLHQLNAHYSKAAAKKQPVKEG